MVPEMETKFCLAGQIIDEARHVQVRPLPEKLGVVLRSTLRSKARAPAPRFRSLRREDRRHADLLKVSRSGVSDVPGAKPRSSDARFIKLAATSPVTPASGSSIWPTSSAARAAERRRIEDFVAELWRLFHHATGSPFGPVNDFSPTRSRTSHRLRLIGSSCDNSAFGILRTLPDARRMRVHALAHERVHAAKSPM
jgi:hypothetical protein